MDKVGVSKASAISEEISTSNRDVLHTETAQKLTGGQDFICNRSQRNGLAQANTHSYERC